MSGAINSSAYPSDDSESQPNTEEIPVRFWAETNWWGDECVGLTPVKERKKFQNQEEYLLKKCDGFVPRGQRNPIYFKCGKQRNLKATTLVKKSHES